MTLFFQATGIHEDNLARRRAADAERHAREAAAAARSAYYRCGDCLAVAVVKPEDKAKIAHGARPECGVCGGTFEKMGDVGPDAKCVRREEQCACDARCTDACGPLCSCSCGGENHGSGRTVEVVLGVDAAPRFLGVKDADKARAVAEEYRAAFAAARARIDAKYRYAADAKLAGRFLSSAEFKDYLDRKSVV